MSKTRNISPSFSRAECDSSN